MHAVQHSHTNTGTVWVMWLAVALGGAGAVHRTQLPADPIEHAWCWRFTNCWGTRHPARGCGLLSDRWVADFCSTPLVMDRRCRDQRVRHFDLPDRDRRAYHSSSRECVMYSSYAIIPVNDPVTVKVMAHT